MPHGRARVLARAKSSSRSSSHRAHRQGSVDVASEGHAARPSTSSEAGQRSAGSCGYWLSGAGAPLAARHSRELCASRRPALSYGDPKMDSSWRRCARSQDSSHGAARRRERHRKEVAARAVHRWSLRAALTFVAINCAALSETCSRASYFGHERVPSPAPPRQARRIELARAAHFSSTKSASSSPICRQLLRVLQEKTFERVGGSRSQRRRRALDRGYQSRSGQDGERRRISGRSLSSPGGVSDSAAWPAARAPLDIPHLARALSEQIGPDIGKPGLVIDGAAQERLLGAAWPATCASSETRSNAPPSWRRARPYGSSTSCSTRSRSGADPLSVRSTRSNAAPSSAPWPR